MKTKNKLALCEIERKAPPISLVIRSKIEDAVIFFQDLVKWWEVKNFCYNAPHFLKQAWHWRAFDYSYTIIAFCENLDKAANALKEDTTHIHAKKTYRRCKTAAGLLRKAYNMHMWDDPSYRRWVSVNESYLEELPNGMYAMKRRRKYPEEYSNKMYNVIYKRLTDKENKTKEEAWAYIHKHIETFWR